MTPANMDADMSDAAENDRQRRAKDGTAGAVPEGEGRRGQERQRDLRSLKSPREGDDLRGESSRVGRAHRPTTPTLEWEYNSGVVIHQSGCDICRQYGIHYFTAMVDSDLSIHKAREARDDAIAAQRAQELRDTATRYKNERDQAWTRIEAYKSRIYSLQRELDTTEDRLSDAQAEIAEQMARAEQLQAALDDRDDSHRQRKRPRGAHSLSRSIPTTRDTSVHDVPPAAPTQPEERGRPTARPPSPMVEEGEIPPRPGLSEKAKGKAPMKGERGSSSPSPPRKRSRHYRRKYGSTPPDTSSESDFAGNAGMDVDDDGPLKGKQSSAAFPAPREAYGVSQDIGTGSSRPRFPYPPERAAPTVPASYAAAITPAASTQMVNLPFTSKHYKKVSKLAQTPGNWGAVEWMKRASTWAHHSELKSPLQKQILREWRQPKWATDMINVGDPSIPPGIKDSLRRAQERRMGVRPPAETAGTGAPTSVPTSAPGPTLGASGQGTGNRAPTQGSPSLDAPIEEHATWLYHHQEQRAREHIPFENGMISLPAVRGHVLVRRLLPPHIATDRMRSAVRRHTQLLLMELIAHGHGYRDRLLQMKLHLAATEAVTPLTGVTLNTTLEDVVRLLAARGIDPALLDDAHRWALQWFTAERKNRDTRFPDLKEIWRRYSITNTSAHWPGVPRTDVAIWFRPAHGNLPRVAQPDLPLEGPAPPTALIYREDPTVVSGSRPTASTSMGPIPHLTPVTATPSTGSSQPMEGPSGPSIVLQQMDTTPDSSGAVPIVEVPDLSSVSLADDAVEAPLDSSSGPHDVTANNNAV